MALALTTTKRKFHKILDSISNASSTSLVSSNNQNNASTTTPPDATESVTKKPRLSRPNSAYTSTNANITPRRSTSTRPSLIQLSPSSMNKERKAPNFAPWDRSKFLERLATFRHVDKWMGKPDKINEVQWAKRGWTCVGRDRVGCVGGCGSEVVIKLEKDQEHQMSDEFDEENQHQDGEASAEGEDEDWRQSAQEQLVDKYAEMIITEHGGGCPWRRKGCDDTIQRLPLAHQNTALDSLHLRYESLVRMAAELPSNISTPPSFNMDKISHFMPRILQAGSSFPSADAPPPYAGPQPFNEVALTLALFGWQAEENHISGLATCTACFRRLGLWLFKSSSISSDGSFSRPASMTRLDVVGEHRDYCPWINGFSQNGNTAPPGRMPAAQSLSGWETLSHILTTMQEPLQESERSHSHSRRPDMDGAASEVGSVAGSILGPEEKASRDEKDKERWAKLKKLKQVFKVKTRKGKGVLATSRPRTAG